MDTSPIVLTDKEERAVRRLELLTELRRAAHVPWFTYVRLGMQLLVPVLLLGSGLVGTSSGVFANPQLAPFMIVMCGISIGTGFWELVIAPMRRRIDAIAKLLENEVHRER